MTKHYIKVIPGFEQKAIELVKQFSKAKKAEITSELYKYNVVWAVGWKKADLIAVLVGAIITKQVPTDMLLDVIEGRVKKNLVEIEA